jgi:hypothetical protein
MAEDPKIVPINPLLRQTLADIYGEANIAALESARSDADGVVNGYADEFLIEPDEAEAQRFRIELERDARGHLDDW